MGVWRDDFISTCCTEIKTEPFLWVRIKGNQKFLLGGLFVFATVDLMGVGHLPDLFFY